MSIALRPYQLIAVERILQEFISKRSTLLVLPTGCGKTIVFSWIIKYFVEQHQRALVLAHRGELLQQAAAKLGQIGLINVGVEKGNRRGKGESIIVASVASLRGKRLADMPRDRFGLIVVDECHRALSATHRAILDHFSSAKVLGVTATPDRLDGKALGQVFDSVAYEYAIQDAIRDRYLVPIRSKRVHVKGLDLAEVKTRMGDFHQGELSEVLRAEKKLHRVADPLVKLAGNRKTVLFTVDVPHAEAMAEVLNRYRPGSARWMSGTLSPRKRRETLEAYRRGDFQFLVNCALLTEGWDEPSLSCVAVARPTQSRALYAQMIGRGTRLHPEKTDLLVLDFVGNSGKHRLAGIADVLGGKKLDDDLATAAELFTGLGDEIDDLVALDMAETFLAAELRRLRVTVVADFIAKEIDPFLPPDKRAASSGRWDDYVQGSLNLDNEIPATPDQLAFLKNELIKAPPELSYDQAATIIERIVARQTSGRCTFKQARWLLKRGHSDPFDLTKKEAQELIGRRLTELRRGALRRHAAR